jgi:hypothetical protein
VTGWTVATDGPVGQFMIGTAGTRSIRSCSTTVPSKLHRSRYGISGDADLGGTCGERTEGARAVYNLYKNSLIVPNVFPVATCHGHDDLWQAVPCQMPYHINCQFFDNGVSLLQLSHLSVGFVQTPYHMPSAHETRD